jgi:hypothetical protein
MKIDLPRLPLPGGQPKDPTSTKSVGFPDVAVTPTPAGPVPIPYPNVGDSFERAAKNPLAALLGGGATKAGGPGGDVRAEQQRLATEAGELLGKGDAAGSAAAWTDAVGHDPGVTIMELLAYTLRGASGDVRADQEALAGRLGKVGVDLATAFDVGLAKIRDGSVVSTEEQTTASAPKVRVSAGPDDPSALVQHALRESYLQTTEDLRSYANQVKGFNEAKKELREAMQGFEEKLAGVGDDAQLANVDLQNVLQRQQQVMQMMSNIAKMMADQAATVIRKIGG